MALPLLNLRFICLISASFIAIFSSIAIYFCLPLLISHVLRTQITLSTHSGSFQQWRLNSVVDRIYLYNITNLNDLFDNSAGESRRISVPSIKQVGPIAFRQDREKTNIKFDSNNETVIYDQVKRWTFLPELSVFKTPEELNKSIINHVSVSLAGSTVNPEYAEFVEPIVSENDLRMFLSHSVDVLLFEGYYDILMENAKAGGQIDVNRFGWMHNQNNSVTKSIRVFTGPSNHTLDRFGLVDEYESRKHFSIWRNNHSEPNAYNQSRCNDFRYSSAGEFFPPPEYSIISHSNYLKNTQSRGDNLNDNIATGNHDAPTAMDRHNSLVNADTFATSRNDELRTHQQKVGKSISIFMPDLCRTIRLYYNGSYHFKDLLVDRYIANEYTFDYTPSNLQEQPNELRHSNDCFCIYNETTRLTSCPPNGMMDLYLCRKGSPVTISFPHFLYSRRDQNLVPYLRMFNEEDEPNDKENQFFVDLESSLNIPVNVQIVIQFNVHIKNDPSLNYTREYSTLFDIDGPENETIKMQDFYLPQMWIRSNAEASDADLKNLRFIQQHLDLITPITTIIIFGFASILLLASAKLAYDLTYGPGSRKTCNQQSCSEMASDHSCSYLQDKQKYFGLQIVEDNKCKREISDNDNCDLSGCERARLRSSSAKSSRETCGLPNHCQGGHADQIKIGNQDEMRPTSSRSAVSCDYSTASSHDESVPLNAK